MVDGHTPRLTGNLPATEAAANPENPWPGGSFVVAAVIHTPEFAPRIARAMDGCEAVLLEMAGGTEEDRAVAADLVDVMIQPPRGSLLRELNVGTVAVLGDNFMAGLIRDMPDSVRRVQTIDILQGTPEYTLQLQAEAAYRECNIGIITHKSNAVIANDYMTYVRLQSAADAVREPVQVADAKRFVAEHGDRIKRVGIVVGLAHRGIAQELHDARYATDVVEVRPTVTYGNAVESVPDPEGPLFQALRQFPDVPPDEEVCVRAMTAHMLTVLLGDRSSAMVSVLATSSLSQLRLLLHSFDAEKQAGRAQEETGAEIQQRLRRAVTTWLTALVVMESVSGDGLLGQIKKIV